MTGQMAKKFWIRAHNRYALLFKFWVLAVSTGKKVSKAVTMLHRSNPDLTVDGPIQSDFALNKKLLQDRFPFSSLINKVNILVFPNLDAANITYKHERIK